MAGPAAAAGAKAAGSAAGKAGGGAATRSGSAKAAKGAGAGGIGRGAGGASRSGGSQGGGGQSSGGMKSLGKLPSFRARREKREGEEDQGMFGSGLIKLIAIGGGGLTFFLLVFIAPLVVFEASADSCGSGESEEAVPIQTNHQTDPDTLGQTQIAIRIYLVGEVMNMTPRQIVTAYATAYVESNMTNIYGGDSDSRGIYQQRNFSPWTDGERNRNNVIDTTISFFLQLREYDNGQPVGILAAEVQKPAEEYEYRYALWVDEATDMYNKVHRIVGTAKGVKSIESLEGVTIGTSGLDSLSLGEACGAFTASGPANVKSAVTLYKPRSFKTLPDDVWANGGEPQQVDTRVWANAVWLLKTYNLTVTAAREDGHATHGDGTALDIVPADGDWDNTMAAARALGWTSDCGDNGLTSSAGGTCNLVPAIIFIGYNGFPSHGDPDHCSGECPAHLHISWYSSCYGCGGGALVPPRDWVKVFPIGPEAEEEKAVNKKPEKKKEVPA